LFVTKYQKLDSVHSMLHAVEFREHL
jgi:hypothetical protein